MCGFLALFGPQLDRSSDEQQARLQRTLTHRGPDDFNRLAGAGFELFSWRLSIVDRSRAVQPMTSPDGNVTVVQNGEIYNYRELARELSAAGSTYPMTGDTEVILAAYEKWGIECFARFEGMFAICVVDRARGRSVLARDRLGVKPLYLHEAPGTMAVASEPKALLAALDLSPSIDRAAVSSYLIFQTVLGSSTLFEGIRKIPPGFVLTYELATAKLLALSPIVPERRPEAPASHADAVEATRELLTQQAALAFDTDLPIAFHLSGGLDSNILVGLHKHLRPKAPAVCVSSLLEGTEDREWEFIRRSAEHHGYRLEAVNVTAGSFFEALDDVMYYMDEPAGDAGVVAQFLTNRECAKHSKIVVSGQGLDEMFFGYIRNLAGHLWDTQGRTALVGDGQGNPGHPFFRGWEGYVGSMVGQPETTPTLGYFRKMCRMDPYRSDLKADPGLISTLRGFTTDTYLRLLAQDRSVGGFMLNTELELQLPTLLHMEDRASMRHSVETRVPFCTASVLDLARCMDARWKVHSGLPKGILREAFSHVVAPHILARTEKVGRPIPLAKWLSEPAGRPMMERLQRDREMLTEMVGLDLTDLALGTNSPYDRLTWALLSLSSWAKAYRVRL